jgi:hypothetical protein
MSQLIFTKSYPHTLSLSLTAFLSPFAEFTLFVNFFLKHNLRLINFLTVSQSTFAALSPLVDFYQILWLTLSLTALNLLVNFC